MLILFIYKIKSCICTWYRKCQLVVINKKKSLYEKEELGRTRKPKDAKKTGSPSTERLLTAFCSIQFFQTPHYLVRPPPHLSSEPQYQTPLPFVSPQRLGDVLRTALGDGCNSGFYL